MKKLLEKKFVRSFLMVAAIAISCFVGAKYFPLQEERVTVKTIYAEDGLRVDAVSEKINVSEADSRKTRVTAYSRNLKVYFNGELLDTKNDGKVIDNTYIVNGVVMTFTEKDGKITATVQYGEVNGKVNFSIKEHKLIKGNNAPVNTPSYGYMFDKNGNKINNGHIAYHEQDLDEKGNVIGIQDESKVVMSEEKGKEIASPENPDTKPENKPEKVEVTDPVSEEKVESDVKHDYNEAINSSDNEAGGAEMSNVEETVEQQPEAPVSQYRQIAIANVNGETLNYVSVNGGEGTLAVVCTAIEGNTYTCMTRTGETIVLTRTIAENGEVTFAELTGIYK